MWKLINSQRGTGRTPFWFWVFPVLALLVVWPPLARWLTDTDLRGDTESTAIGPSIEASGAQSIIVREAGRKVWEFSAQRIEVSADHRFATATGVGRGVLYRDGKPFLQVRADQIRVNQESRDWEAVGNLRAQGPDGFTIQSRRALWKYRTQQLQCPETVQATLRGAQIVSHGVVYDSKRSELRCPQPVAVKSERATLKTRAGTQVVVDIKNQRITGQGGVEIVIRPQM